MFVVRHIHVQIQKINNSQAITIYKRKGVENFFCQKVVVCFWTNIGNMSPLLSNNINCICKLYLLYNLFFFHSHNICSLNDKVPQKARQFGEKKSKGVFPAFPDLGIPLVYITVYLFCCTVFDKDFVAIICLPCLSFILAPCLC